MNPIVAKVGGVKAYFNSDFGTDYDPETWGSSAYEAKKAHRAAAEKLGIKTIAVAVSAFEQSFRSELFGMGLTIMDFVVRSHCI